MLSDSSFFTGAFCLSQQIRLSTAAGLEAVLLVAVANCSLGLLMPDCSLPRYNEYSLSDPNVVSLCPVGGPIPCVARRASGVLEIEAGLFVLPSLDSPILLASCPNCVRQAVCSESCNTTCNVSCEIVGGAATTLCLNGTRSFLCSQCERGYFSRENRCVLCVGGSTWILVVSFLAMLGLLLSVVAIKQTGLVVLLELVLCVALFLLIGFFAPGLVEVSVEMRAVVSVLTCFFFVCR